MLYFVKLINYYKVKQTLKHLFFMGDSNTLNNTSVIDNYDWTLAAEVAWNVQHDSSCNYSLLKETINAYK